MNLKPVDLRALTTSFVNTTCVWRANAVVSLWSGGMSAARPCGRSVETVEEPVLRIHHMNTSSCGPQKFRPALSSLLFQAIFVMQAAENGRRFDAEAGGEHVPMAAVRNAVLGWFRA